jgi:hypothetical protein
LPSTADLRAKIRELEDEADALDVQAELRTHTAALRVQLQDAEGVSDAAAESERAAVQACAPVRARAHQAAQRVAQLSNVIKDKSLPVDTLAEARTQRRSYQDEGAEILAMLDQLEAASVSAQASREVADLAVTHLQAQLVIAADALSAPLVHPVALQTQAYKDRIMRGLWVGVLAADSYAVPDRAIANKVLDYLLTHTERGRWVLMEDRREVATIASRVQEYADLITESNDLNRMAEAITNRLRHAAPPAVPSQVGGAGAPPAQTVVPTYTGGRLGV